jgi:hypothetical protein
VAEDGDPERLLEEAHRDPPQRHSGGGLPGAGPFQDRPGLVEVVLLHPGEVRVAGPWPGQGRVARLARQHVGVDGVGRHHRLPLRPLRVADLDGDRPALGLAVAYATQDGHRVRLELHPGAASEAEPAPGQRVGDVGGRHPYAGGHALQGRHQRGTVGFTSS